MPWTIDEILNDRDEKLAMHRDWLREDLEWVNEQARALRDRGVGGHTADAIQDSSQICVGIARGLANRPEKVREFLTLAYHDKLISEGDASTLGRDSWIQFVYAMRIYPAVHACLTGTEARETRYAGDLGDWHHAVFARVASHVVTDDLKLVKVTVA